MASDEQEERVERCENCRFWLADVTKTDWDLTHCRKGTPHYWVAVKAHDWCGEFKPHPKSQEEIRGGSVVLVENAKAIMQASNDAMAAFVKDTEKYK